MAATARSGDVDPALYPEVARAGSLAAPLEDLAGRHDIDLGADETRHGNRHAIDAHLTSQRGNIIDVIQVTSTWDETLRNAGTVQEAISVAAAVVASHPNAPRSATG